MSKPTYRRGIGEIPDTVWQTMYWPGNIYAAGDPYIAAETGTLIKGYIDTWGASFARLAVYEGDILIDKTENIPIMPTESYYFADFMRHNKIIAGHAYFVAFIIESAKIITEVPFVPTVNPFKVVPISNFDFPDQIVWANGTTFQRPSVWAAIGNLQVRTDPATEVNIYAQPD